MQNNKRYWLRGVLVTFILLLVWIGLLSIENNSGNLFSKILDSVTLILDSVTFFFTYLPAKFTQLVVPFFCPQIGFLACLTPTLLIGITSVLVEILGIGALLGYLYGKIKNRNKV